MSISQEMMVRKLDELISEGNKRIGDQKEDRAILILGETGAGKSTLTYLFAGKTLKADQSEEGEMIIDTTEPVDGVKISHKKISETKIPTKIKSASGLVVWDCPGFGDLGRDPIQDIANSFYIQRLFETTKELKFVLVVPEHNTKGRGENLLRVVDHFVKIFRDISEIKDSVSLVVTQAASTKTSEHIKTTLKNILRDNESIDPQNKLMLEYLSNSVEVFHTPKETGLINKILTSMFLGSQAAAAAEEVSILASIEAKTKYLTTTPGSANVVISKNSEALASQLFESAHKSLFDLLTNMSGEITKICSKVNARGNEITVPRVANSQETTRLKSFFAGFKDIFTPGKSPTKTSSAAKHVQAEMSDVPPSYKELLNLDSILAFDAFCDLAIRPDPNIQNWLVALEDNISSVVSKINQYDIPAAAAAADQHDVRPIDYRIKEIIKYVLFLSKVSSGKNIEQQKVIDIFTACKEAVKTAALKGAEDFALSDTESAEEYYVDAISFLDRYPDNQKCKISKSNACFHIARIQGSNDKKVSEAIANCIKSIDLNPDKTSNVQSYDLINKLCKKDNDRLPHVVKSSSVQKNGILDYLFEKNNKEMIDISFLQLNDTINCSLRQKMDTIKTTKKDSIFLQIMDLSIEIQKLITSICSGKISTKMDSLKSDLFQVLDKIGSDIKRKEIDSLIAYLEAINIGTQHRHDAKIDSWTSHFNIKLVEKAIVEMVKSIDLNCSTKMKYFIKVIEYTSLPIVDQSTNISLDQDRECINKRSAANYKIGELHQSAQDYRSAVDHYVKAIQLNRELGDAYKKLDEIYFMRGAFPAIVKDTALLQKLLDNNNQELTSMLNSKLLNFIVGYKGAREHFHQAPAEAYVAALQYLKNLTNLSQMVSKISALSTSASIDHIEFIGCLYQMAAILEMEFKKPQISSRSEVQNICESTIKCSATDVFEITRLEKQIEYIAYLGSISTEIDSTAKKMIIDAAKLVAGTSDMVSSILKYTQAIDLNYDETSSTYYEQVSEYVGKYPEDKLCVKINTHAHLCLAKIATTSQGKIKCYQQTIILNEKLFTLCNGMDNAFYAEHSVKRKAYEKLGDLYFELGDLKAALEQFKLIDQHVKVKTCFHKLISTNQNNHTLREEQADYFAKKAMIDSAVDSYAEALSLTNTDADHSRINKKIAATLASVGSKSAEFKSRAESIDSTKIVYSVSDIIYDNPVLNHRGLVEEFTRIFGANAASRLIDITGDLSMDSGVRDCIEGLCQGTDALSSLGTLIGETTVNAM